MQYDTRIKTPWNYFLFAKIPVIFTSRKKLWTIFLFKWYVVKCFGFPSGGTSDSVVSAVRLSARSYCIWKTKVFLRGWIFSWISMFSPHSEDMQVRLIALSVGINVFVFLADGLTSYPEHTLLFVNLILGKQKKWIDELWMEVAGAKTHQGLSE